MEGPRLRTLEGLWPSGERVASRERPASPFQILGAAGTPQLEGALCGHMASSASDLSRDFAAHAPGESH